MATKKITTKSVAALKAGARITDTEIRGFLARCLPSGKVQLGYQYTDKATGRRRWITLGLLGEVTVKEARDRAKKYAGQVSDRRDPVTEQKNADAIPRDRILSAEEHSQLYIRQHREARGITLTEFAKRIGKTKGLVSQVENGRTAPSLETLEDIAEFFGLAHAGMLFEPPVPKGWRRIMSIIPDNTLR